jgi:hypothetical protein
LKKGLPPAEEVIIELDPRNIRKWSRHIQEQGEEVFLKSVAKRAKYEFLLEKVVEQGYVGTFPKEIVWEGSTIAWDTDYKVVTTTPKGEVQITTATLITCQLRK